MGGQIPDAEQARGSTIWGGGWRLHIWTAPNGRLQTKWSLYLRPATLFNADQIHGLDEKIPPSQARSHTPIAACESMLAKFKDGPEVRESPERAYYQPFSDVVGIPPPEYFKTASAFYATLFHELIHATGHQSRLGRFETLTVAFGQTDPVDYAREELVADLGAAFLCLEAAIVNETVKEHTAYLGSWIAELDERPKALFQVIAASERAVNWIVGQRQRRVADERVGPQSVMSLGIPARNEATRWD